MADSFARQYEVSIIAKSGDAVYNDFFLTDEEYNTIKNIAYSLRAISNSDSPILTVHSIEYAREAEDYDTRY